VGQPAATGRAVGSRKLPLAWIWPFVALAAAGLFPLLVSRGSFLITLAVFVGIYYIVCLALTMVFGLAAQLSLASGALFGVGAYTSALLTTRLGVPVLAGFGAAALLTAAIGWVVARPIARLRQFYLAMATLALCGIGVVVMNQEVALTGGPTGIIRIPRPAIGAFAIDSAFRYYFLVLACATVATWVSRNVVKSRLGRALRAVGSSEVGAVACGIDPVKYKVFIFTLGAALTGLAGGLYAHFISFISPDSFTVRFSVLIVMMVAVGGVGSVGGAFAGALFMVAMQNYFAQYAQYGQLVLAAAFVGVMAFMPDGLVGLLRRAKERVQLWMTRDARTGR
jgi:branched-chain amino acid transport system permease protein